MRSNIFALATTAQLQRTRQEDHLSFTFRRNIVYWTQGDLLNGSWQDTGHFVMDDNLYWDAGSHPVRFQGKTFDQWQKSGQDLHSIIADPRFVNPKHADFRLKAGSPARKLGFIPFDLGVPSRRDKNPGRK